jgi:uncharacterized membrane protein
MAETLQRLLLVVTVFAAVATLPVGLLVGLFVGLVPAAAVFVVGWLLVVPVSALLGGMLGSDGFSTVMDETVQGAMEGETESGTSGGESDPDPLAMLRERYASGEIDEAEFERRLERLVATEDIPPEAVSDAEPGDSAHEPGTDTTSRTDIESGTETDEAASSEREPARER